MILKSKYINNCFLKFEYVADNIHLYTLCPL